MPKPMTGRARNLARESCTGVHREEPLPLTPGCVHLCGVCARVVYVCVYVHTHVLVSVPSEDGTVIHLYAFLW